MKRHVQVLIDGDAVYDEQVDSGEIAYNNRDGLLTMMAGPGTAAWYLAGLYGVH